MLPGASVPDGSASPLTALFTATSATFVVGLIVVDTGTYWTGFGQAIIITLIEVGGLGYITGIAFVLLMTGRRVSLVQRQMLRISFGGGILGRVDAEARTIIIVALFLQAVGIAVLFSRFVFVYSSPLEAGWQSLFHAVSAFNNAGFDISGASSSLSEFRSDPFVIVPITLLSLIGALSVGTVGAIVMVRRWQPLSLNTKLVLVGTGVIILIGTIGILASEWTNEASIGTGPIWRRVMDVLTISIGSRTSGFSSFDIASMRDYTLLLVIVLMFVGGAAGSVAGGIKVNVLSVLLATVWSSIRGKPQTEAFRHEIAESQVRRALAITFIAFTIVNAATLLLSLLNDFELIQVLFEVVSAFGLVGLSTGITAELTALSKVVIIFLMFLGRLALFMIVLKLAQRETSSPYRYAREEVRIG